MSVSIPAGPEKKKWDILIKAERPVQVTASYDNL